MYVLIIKRKGEVIGTGASASVRSLKDEAAKTDGAGATLVWQRLGGTEFAHSMRDDERSYTIHRAKEV